MRKEAFVLLLLSCFSHVSAQGKEIPLTKEELSTVAKICSPAINFALQRYGLQVYYATWHDKYTIDGGVKTFYLAADAKFDSTAHANREISVFGCKVVSGKPTVTRLSVQLFDNDTVLPTPQPIYSFAQRNEWVQPCYAAILAKHSATNRPEDIIWTTMYKSGETIFTDGILWLNNPKNNKIMKKEFNCTLHKGKVAELKLGAEWIENNFY